MQPWPSGSPETPPRETAEGLRYLGRQPIVDLRGRTQAYELLYRSGPVASFCGDGDHATRTMLDNVVLFGLEQLTGGLPAFINCTAESLTGGLVEVLPRETAVLELLESLEPTEELIAACRSLKKSGYRIALDDFDWRPEMEPLVALADYIKVDFLALNAGQRRALLARLEGGRAMLVAEKIETFEDYQQARAEGFRCFQGYYFSRPVLLKNRTVPANCMLHMEILKHLQTEPTEVAILSRLIKRDPSLTLRLLRLANSAICAVRQRVNSIQSALVVMGDEMLRRVLTLAIACEWSTGRPPAILDLAFARGRFCELAARDCGLPPNEQYLVGMLSMLPAMLRMPMEVLLPSLPLRAEVCDALMGVENGESILLRLSMGFEQGDWPACDAIIEANGLKRERLNVCYREAAMWAGEAHRVF